MWLLGDNGRVQTGSETASVWDLGLTQPCVTRAGCSQKLGSLFPHANISQSPSAAQTWGPSVDVLHAAAFLSFPGLSSFQESVAMDRIQRIMGVLQNPFMG